MSTLCIESYTQCIQKYSFIHLYLYHIFNITYIYICTRIPLHIWQQHHFTKFFENIKYSVSTCKSGRAVEEIKLVKVADVNWQKVAPKIGYLIEDKTANSISTEAWQFSIFIYMNFWQRNLFTIEMEKCRIFIGWIGEPPTDLLKKYIYIYIYEIFRHITFLRTRFEHRGTLKIISSECTSSISGRNSRVVSSAYCLPF